MRFTLEKNRRVVTLIELFKVIKGLNNFCKMYCKEDELFIQIMDDSHISLLEIKIKKEWFSSYESNGEVVSFNSKILTTIMGLRALDSITTFETSEEHLYISFQQKDKIEKTFQIVLIDLESDLMESQQIDPSLEFSIGVRKLDQYFNELQSFGDTLELVHVNDTIYMRSQGDEGKYTLKITDDLLDELIVEEELQMVCKVTLKQTSLVTKLYSVFKRINVSASEDAPFTLRILPDEEEEKDLLEIKFFIAPKVDDEGDFDFSEFETEGVNNSVSSEEELDNYENEVMDT